MFKPLTFLFAISELFALALAGGFENSCNSISLSQDGSSYILNAQCEDSLDEFEPANINLDDCIVNNGGNLICQKNGGFSASCHDCEIGQLGDVFLQCTCNGNSNFAEINLNDCVSNINGILSC